MLEGTSWDQESKCPAPVWWTKADCAGHCPDEKSEVISQPVTVLSLFQLKSVLLCSAGIWYRLSFLFLLGFLLLLGFFVVLVLNFFVNYFLLYYLVSSGSLPPPSSFSPFRCLHREIKPFWTFIFQAEQPQLSRFLLIWRIFQSLNHLNSRRFCNWFWGWFLWVFIFFSKTHNQPWSTISGNRWFHLLLSEVCNIAVSWCFICYMSSLRIQAWHLGRESLYTFFPIWNQRTS